MIEMKIIVAFARKYWKQILGGGVVLAFFLALWYAYDKGYDNATEKAEKAMLEFKLAKEKELSELKLQASNINEKVVTEYVDRVNTIETKEIIYRDAAEKLTPTANLSKGWISLHDSAVRFIDPNAQLAADTAPSGVMDTTALAVVLKNYSICKQNTQQLISLQRWIQESQQAVEAMNAGKTDD